MPIARVQSKAAKVASGTTCPITFDSNVTAGNAIIISIGCSEAKTPTFTASDSLGNTYTMGAARNTTHRTTEIGYFLNLPSGGANTVTVTASQSAAFFVVGEEVSGLASSSQPNAGSGTSNTTVTTHNTAASGQLDTTVADCYLMAVAVSGTSFGGGTPGTSPGTWTELYDDAGSGGRYCQSIIISSTITDDRCAFTCVSSGTSGACVAAFSMASAGSASGPVFGRGRTFDNSRTMGGSLIA